MDTINGQYTLMGGHAVFQDGSVTPQKSPLSINDSLTEIKIPENAVVCYMRCHGADVRIGKDATHSTGYMLVSTGEWSPPIPVIDGNSLYVRTDSGSDNLTFIFEIV